MKHPRDRPVLGGDLSRPEAVGDGAAFGGDRIRFEFKYRKRGSSYCCSFYRPLDQFGPDPAQRIATHRPCRGSVAVALATAGHEGRRIRTEVSNPTPSASCISANTLCRLASARKTSINTDISR